MPDLKLTEGFLAADCIAFLYLVDGGQVPNRSSCSHCGKGA